MTHKIPRHWRRQAHRALRRRDRDRARVAVAARFGHAGRRGRRQHFGRDRGADAARVEAHLGRIGEGRHATADLVKVTTSLTNARDIVADAKIRGEILGDVWPEFMHRVVTQLIKPEVLVEVEIIAAAK